MYLDPELDRRLDEEATARHVSRSALARTFISEQLALNRQKRRWPAATLAALGAWEDDRPLERLLAENRAQDVIQPDRAFFE
jgi:predicted transcriptional regulator